MKGDAPNRPLSQEDKVKEAGDFIDLKRVKDWISQHGDRLYVYVVRNQSGKMIKSYCWKGIEWGTVNCDTYLGGFKIGKPRHNICCRGCSCCGTYPSQNPDHPAIKSKDYE